MISKYLLFPYYLTLKIRNSLYDKGTLSSQSYGIPVCSVGNVTVGGTGKTPMTEYIVAELSKSYRVAVVSRGYKRKSKGFTFVNTDDTSTKVGDEPLQIKRKFPNVIVAVDSRRTRAIEQLLALPSDARPEIILFDDGFQYRKVTPSKNIILVDYNRPIFKDNLLPIGHLRDIPEEIRRAQVIVITKSPDYLDQWEREKMRILTRTRHTQKVFFSKINYCSPKPVFDGEGDNRYIYSKEVHLFAGIANLKPIILHLSGKYEHISHRKFSDHHRFTRLDIASLNFYAKNNPRKLLLTTEKDAQRLCHNRHLSEDVRKRLFFLPIETDFLTLEEKQEFNEMLKEGLPQKFSGLLF